MARCALSNVTVQYIIIINSISYTVIILSCNHLLFSSNRKEFYLRQQKTFRPYRSNPVGRRARWQAVKVIYFISCILEFCNSSSTILVIISLYYVCALPPSFNCYGPTSKLDMHTLRYYLKPYPSPFPIFLLSLS